MCTRTRACVRARERERECVLCLRVSVCMCVCACFDYTVHGVRGRGAYRIGCPLRPTVECTKTYTNMHARTHTHTHTRADYLVLKDALERGHEGAEALGDSHVSALALLPAHLVGIHLRHLSMSQVCGGAGGLIHTYRSTNVQLPSFFFGTIHA